MLYAFHGRGRNCRYSTKPSEDVVVTYKDANINSVTEAEAYLKGLDTELIDKVDNDKVLKEGSSTSTWASTVVTPDGYVVWAARGDAQITLFTYDEKTKEVTPKVLNMLHNPLTEMAWLESLESRTEEQEKRLKAFNGGEEETGSVSGSGRINETIAISRGFGSSWGPGGFMGDDGFRHESDFDSIKLNPNGKRLFLMTSSDGMFEYLPYLFDKERCAVQDGGFCIAKVDELGEVKINLNNRKKAQSIVIDNTEIDVVDYKFEYKGMSYAIYSGLNSMDDIASAKNIYIGITRQNVLMQQYCNIIECNIGNLAKASQMITNTAKSCSTDDLSYTFMEVTTPPKHAAVISNLFDGSSGQDASKKCGEVTKEYAEGKGCKDLVCIIAKTKDDKNKAITSAYDIPKPTEDKKSEGGPKKVGVPVSGLPPFIKPNTLSLLFGTTALCVQAMQSQLLGKRVSDALSMFSPTALTSVKVLFSVLAVSSFIYDACKGRE